MVDFNNEATIATPAIDVKRILVLQARHFLIEALEAYRKQELSGVDTDTNVISSRVYSLFLEVKSGLRRHLSKKDYEELSLLVKENDYLSIEIAFDMIDRWLDDIGLTRIDIKPKLGGNIAARNKAQGWKA